MNYELTPIVLFIYNRPYHTKQTVEALEKNELAKDSILYIFSDGPKGDKDVDKVNEVREYIKTVNGFKDVIITESEKNKGLANSIISGVTEVINKHERVIVLEDDLITSQSFILYINKLLNYYEDIDKIYSVTGYNHSKKLMKVPDNYNYNIYFCPRACSWSWATWKNRWEKVDWKVKDYDRFLKNKKDQIEFNKTGNDKSKMLISQMNGEIDSWAIRWDYHHFKNNAYCIYPTKSYINNIGHDGSGVHCGSSRKNKYENKILNDKKELKIPNEIIINEDLINEFKKVYDQNLIKKYIIKLFKLFRIYNIYKKIRHKK